MNLYSFSRDRFEQILREIAQEIGVYLPQEVDGEVRFRPWDLVTLDTRFPRPARPAKEFFLPPAETLLYFRRDGSAQKELFDEERRILVGVRPCDAKTVQLLDRVFLADPSDPYYRARRETTLILAFACPQPEMNCFCRELGDGPDRVNGADGLLFDRGDRLELLAVTPALDALFRPHEHPAREIASAQELRAPEQEAERLPLAELFERLPGLIQDSRLWSRIESTCVGCGACSYLCPTCHCFDISDQVYGRVGKRLRTYDSCMFPAYTLEASGHNPRSSGLERWRQRLMHKFRYTPELTGEVGCTGCGRCIDCCPSKIDIREVIRNAAGAR